MFFTLSCKLSRFYIGEKMESENERDLLDRVIFFHNDKKQKVHEAFEEKIR